ncbi:ABC transporter permease subunit [Azospirillum thermophilum]|uniref:Peptide ABC transporter permease n=1 Tax=Azospirillum thermophilum TaxID=2202148 RepID=A0A2S2CTA1_9PROT|nr:ABC transporter permease subunit [Azospirillum thermophilum]AWK87753.1 peptide ABC transporter permease [Azospirillum thermophilum]
MPVPALSPEPPQSALHRLATNRRASAGLVLLAAMALAALAAPLLPSGLPNWAAEQPANDPVVATLVEARGSLSFALLAGLLGAAVGIGWAVLAVFLGRQAERSMMRLAERLAGTPLVLAVLLLSGLSDRSAVVLSLAVALSTAPVVAGMAQAELRALMRREFLVAARANGLDEQTVFRRHLLPNALWSLAAAGWLALPRALAAECFASLLGLGLQQGGSWGGAVAAALERGDAVAALLPVVLLAATLWALGAVGDGLRAAGKVP